MKRFLTIGFALMCLLILKSNLLFSQVDSDDIMTMSETNQRIDILAHRYNKTHKLHGYRIQLMSSSKNEKAKKAKSRFASKYQLIQVHLIYQQPFFIIKAGDFLTKIEAEKFQRIIESDFPGSFVIPDIIYPYKQYTFKDLN